MATKLQDYQAKRKELQATNPNATMLDAKSALSPTPAPIANAPVAGQAPAITPITPTPTTPATPSVHANGPSATEAQNQAIRQQNAVKVQNEIATGERPQVGQKATPEQVPQIVQQAQKETPTEPVTPTETTTPTTSTTTPTTPTPTTSSAPVITPDSNSIYTNLRSNTPLPDAVKSTQAYKDAQSRYNNFQKYASYDVNTLTTALSNGTILPGTSTWNDLMTDPVMGGKILQAKALTNGKGADYITTTQQVSDNIVSNSPTVSGMLADGQITADEWATATNTPEVTAKMSDVEAKKNAYDALKAKYDDVETQVKADFPGSPFADSIIADRRKSMFKDLTIASDTYNNALGTLTQLKQDAGNLFETNMKLYQEQKAVENQKAMIEYQAKIGLQSKVAEQQVADELARQAQNDPTKAIPLLVEQYTKLGIPMQRSTQGMIQEAQNVIANGGNLADYLTELQGKIQSKPEYQAILAKKAGEGTSYVQYGDKVYKNVNGVLTLTDISAKSTPTPVWQEWTDSNGVSHAEWITPGVNPTTSTGVKGTGNIVPVTAGGKTVRLDQVGASGFENAVNQLTANGTPIVIGQGERDQVATIKSMAEKAGIPFNASNPAETAGKLRAKGMQVADPGKSNHESGMAIDVYGSSKLDAVTPEQEKILNANGWYSAGIPGDAGHFEYRGGTQGVQNAEVDIPAYQKYLNSGAFPTGIKAGTAKANEWLQGYSQWKSTSNPLSETIQKRVDSYSDDYSKNPNVVSAFKFAPLLRQYDKIKVSDLSSSQRQGIISDYAKALDPDSVVREGEYATVAKYSSSFGEKTLSEMKQFLSGNGTLSDEAAQKVIDAIKSRGKNYIEQEKNIRNQYVEKINRTTGYKDGETQLIYPDYATDESRKAKADLANILPGVSGFKGFMSELSTLLNQ